MQGEAHERSLELGSAQTRSWRTASNGFAELRKAFQNPAKPLEAVRQDRVWAEPSSREHPRSSYCIAFMFIEPT